MIYLLAILAAGLLGIGFVLQQRVAERAPQRDFLRLRLLADLLADRRWIVGVAIMVCGQLLSAWVIGHVVLSVAEPILASNLLFALVLARPLSGQRLAASEIAGALILIAGVTVLSLDRSIRSGEITVGSAGNWPYAIAGVAMAAYAFAAIGRRQQGAARGAFTGVSAGIVFGLQDALTRQVVIAFEAHGIASLVTSWPSYALVATGIVALWLMQSAFNSAPLHASLPGMTAGEPFVGTALGIIVFGDKLHTSAGLLALQFTAFAALVGGVILVTRGPSLATACAGKHLPKLHEKGAEAPSVRMTAPLARAHRDAYSAPE